MSNAEAKCGCDHFNFIQEIVDFPARWDVERRDAAGTVVEGNLKGGQKDPIVNAPGARDQYWVRYPEVAHQLSRVV